jgi:hypothetical protein
MKTTRLSIPQQLLLVTAALGDFLLLLTALHIACVLRSLPLAFWTCILAASLFLALLLLNRSYHLADGKQAAAGQ